MGSRRHLGKEDLKSGKVVTPGHVFSSGVPRILSIVSYTSNAKESYLSLEDLEYLVDFRIAWEERFSGAHLCKDRTD